MQVASGVFSTFWELCISHMQWMGWNSPDGPATWVLLCCFTFHTGPPGKHNVLAGKPVLLVHSRRSLQLYPPLSGQPGCHASVAPAEAQHRWSPPGWPVHWGCAAASRNAESHHEPGKTHSWHVVWQGSDGKMFGRVTLTFLSSFQEMAVISKCSSECLIEESGRAPGDNLNAQWENQPECFQWGLPILARRLLFSICLNIWLSLLGDLCVRSKGTYLSNYFKSGALRDAVEREKGPLPSRCSPLPGTWASHVSDLWIRDLS